MDDPRNQLIAHFCRLVEELQPTAFVLENVPDLLLPKYAGLIEPSLQQLQQAGYNTWTWVLNAFDYGVPQNRKRVFIGGILRDTSPLLPAAASQVATVREAIGDLTKLSQEAFPQLFDTDELQLDLKQPTLEAQPSEYALKLEQVFPSPPTTNPHLLTGCCFTHHTPSVVQRFEATAPGTTEPNSRLYRLKWDGVARTLRAGTGSDKGRHTAARPIHPTHARVLTVRSCGSPVLFPGLVPLSSSDLAGYATSWECRATAIGAGSGESHLSMFDTTRGCNSNGDSGFNWRTSAHIAHSKVGSG